MCFHRQQEVLSTIHRELLFKLKLKMMQIDIRNLKIDDYNELREAMKKAYPAMSENIWSKKSIEKNKFFNQKILTIEKKTKSQKMKNNSLKNDKAYKKKTKKKSKSKFDIFRSYWILLRYH